jgi:CHAD domain-containing protein
VRAAIESAGFRLEPDRALTHEDRYLDTDDWALHRAGIALRIRADGQRVRLEVKSLRSTSEEALERTEWAQDAPEGDPPWTALPDGPVAALLWPLTGLRVLERLRVIATVRNERETWRWLREDHALGSMTVDRVLPGAAAGPTAAGPTAAAAPGGNGAAATPASYREVEIETLNGADEALGAVRRAIEGGLGVEASVETKLEAALHAAGIVPPRRDERAYALTPGDRLVDVAHKTLGRHLTRMLWHEPGARLGVDPERVHDMRVASRRLRTMLEVLDEAIPSDTRERFAGDLRRVGRALGRVRDVDVQLVRVAALRAESAEFERPALDVFARWLEIRRARERTRLLGRLDSERYAAFVAEARVWVEAPPPSADSGSAAVAPAYHTGQRLTSARLRDLLEAYDTAERSLAPEDLHALRIAAKKLRYTVEYFADLTGPGSARRAKRLARFQDFLGERQDTATLLRRMKQYARTIPPGDRELALGAGSALGHLGRLAHTKRGDLHRAWGDLGET